MSSNFFLDYVEEVCTSVEGDDLVWDESFIFTKIEVIRRIDRLRYIPVNSNHLLRILSSKQQYEHDSLLSIALRAMATLELEAITEDTHDVIYLLLYIAIVGTLFVETPGAFSIAHDLVSNLAYIYNVSHNPPPPLKRRKTMNSTYYTFIAENEGMCQSEEKALKVWLERQYWFVLEE